MLATIGAVTLFGLRAQLVRVECDLGQGLPGTRVIGLPDAAVREAADRVRSAVRRSGLPWPANVRIVLNLAPAAVQKTGAGFDLAFALAIVATTPNHYPEGALDGVAACAEVGLDGRLRPVPGLLPMAIAARDAGVRRLVVARRGASEAALADGLDVVAADTLAEADAILRGVQPGLLTPSRPVDGFEAPLPDLVDIRGQYLARRALEVAAAGGHHLLLVGPPGCGKSMLARRLPGVLPSLDAAAALEVAAIHSVAGVRDPDAPVSFLPPWQAPHQGASAAGLIGGGSGVPRPGAMSLAHRGVLFLDELLETPRATLDALRTPLERGMVTLVRARGTVTYPAQVQLVAATNPCPCGHLGSVARGCRCRPDRVATYRSRLSGPLLDRIDLHVDVAAVDHDALVGPPDGEPSAVVRARVAAARDVAAARWAMTVPAGPVRARPGRRPPSTNREASVPALRTVTTPEAVRTAADVVRGLGLSARAFDRALRVGRTIADLDGAELTQSHHVEEALAYRLASLATA